MEKGLIKNIICVFATVMVLILVMACGSDDDSSGGSGNEIVISETTTMTSLTINEGEIYVAPDGYSLTMTVDGIETPMNPGNYTGNIVLTVTEQIPVTYSSATGTVYWRTAVYVEDGVYVPEKSVDAAMVGGTVTDTAATDVSIISVGPNFNGIVVTGNSAYTINNPVITFTGNGGNDFSGYGAAIVSKGTSDVTVNEATINNTGVVRTAIFVGDQSTMTVNNSEINVYNGTLPADYSFTVEMGKMMEVPWMLGLVGNCRATNLVGTADAYYNNTIITAQGWGCLSTDDTDNPGVTLTATDCIIETDESGYGAYSIGDGTLDIFSGCTIDVHDMAMIMANGTASGVFTKSAGNITHVTSDRFGVMFHAGNSGTLTINEGTVFDTAKAVFEVKSASPTIQVDNSTLNPANGIILQAMNNDDPNMGGSGGTVNATFSNMQDAKAMNGDIVNAMSGTVNVIIENATITGAITTATATAVGPISQATYYNIGEVKNEYEATGYGMTVSLDMDSDWIVDKTSYLTGLYIASGATIEAPVGYNVTMTFDETPMPIAAGNYEGSIVLTVTPAI